MNLTQKLSGALATAAAMGLLLTGSALAADIEITDNGAGSQNTVTVTEVSTCTVFQGTETNVIALVSAKASTGGNKAIGNTGGDVTVTSGDATATASLTVTGGSNTATDPCCCKQNCCQEEGCASPETVKIADNGALSKNTVTKTKVGTSSVHQAGATNVLAAVKAKARTGKNKALFNTGGTTTVESGVATSDATKVVTGGSNNLP